MGALDNILIPSLRMEEIASDGSTLSNPAADSRRLFLGEDGILHLRDSAGTVTDIGGSGDVATDAIWAAKGDLAAGTGADAAAVVTVGADYTFLQALDAAGSTGMQWGGAFTGWTPALTASSVNPTMGSGATAAGRYLRIGQLIIAHGAIVFGSSGVGAGTGDYRISLPVTMRAPSSLDGNHLGQAYLYDSSITTVQLAACIYQSTTTLLLRTHASTGAVGAAVPWAWAANDALIFHLMYEAA